MPYYSAKSLERLATCHPTLQRLFHEVIKHIDIAVIQGHRGKQQQDQAYEDRLSTKPWPQSKHNTFPSLAIDVAPYPINWADSERFYHMIGFIRGVASQQGIKIRVGGDWDGDFDLKDQNFYDLPHVELVL